jgi:hypothetical protein
VSNARAAVLRKGLAKVFASAMQSHGEIVPGEAEPGSDFGGILPFQIDLLEKVAVLLGYKGQEAFEALAENAFVLNIGRFGEFLFKPFESASASILPPVNVDDGTSQDSIKPCCCGLLAFRLAICCQRLYKAVLHNIFGQVRVVQTATGERCEDLQVFQERIFKTAHWNRLPTLFNKGNFTKRERCVMS